jgi:plasmid stabilization system protein ParE
VNLRVSGRAKARIRHQDEWWRSHRLDAPDLFKEELAVTFSRIARHTKVRRPHTQIEGEPVWRVFMPRTEQHVYYTVNEAADEIVIETVWGARRKRGPKL